MRRRLVKSAVSMPTAESLLGGANPEQAEVIAHNEGPLLVGAVAGAGKTNALTKRVAYLEAVHKAKGARILVVTFSKKAANEMQERLDKLVPNAQARMGTFHSVALEFLKTEFPQRRIGDEEGWEVDEHSGYRFCVKDAIGWRGMDWKRADLTVILQFIGLCKARCAPADTKAAEDFAQLFYSKNPCDQRDPKKLVMAYSMAENLRKDRRLITFDDMLLEMWQVLSSNEDVRPRWAARWDYVMQDEAQDENLVQRSIAEMLSKDHRNYMVVGDPAQSIYGFRGSDPSGLLAFAQKWGAKTVLMNRNYRSGDSIVKAANGVLGAMAAGTHLGMQIKGERGTPGVVSGAIYLDADHEAEEVIGQMMQLMQDALQGNGGASYKDMLILYRTNAMSRAFEEVCLRNRVPYVVVGGTNFYDRKEIKDLISYLRIAAGRGTFDDVKRAINAPFRYLGAAFVQKIQSSAPRSSRDGTVEWTRLVEQVAQQERIQFRQKESVSQWSTLIEGCAKEINAARKVKLSNPSVLPHPDARPAALLERILQLTEYVAWLQRDEGTESTENNRVSNVRELVRSAGRFPTVDEFLDYVQETVDAAERAVRSGEEVERITMMSIHRSKGLEKPVVAVVGVNESILPHGRAEDLNEERRLAYVAFTRARDTLMVSCVARAAIGTKVVAIDPSIFIEEAGIVLVSAPERMTGAPVQEAMQ